MFTTVLDISQEVKEAIADKMNTAADKKACKAIYTKPIVEEAIKDCEEELEGPIYSEFIANAVIHEGLTFDIKELNGLNRTEHQETVCTMKLSEGF